MIKKLISILAASLLLSAAARAGDKISVLIVDGQNNHAWQQTTPLMKKELEACGRFNVDVATSPAKVNPPSKPKEPNKPKEPSKPVDGNDATAKAKYEKDLADYQKAQAKYEDDLAKFQKTLPMLQAKYEDDLAKYKAAEGAYREAMAKFRPEFSKYQVVLLNYNGDPWSEAAQSDLEEYVAGGKGGLVIVHAANNSFTGWKQYNLMIGMGWRGNSFGDRLTTDDQGKEVRVDKGKGPGAGHGAKHPFTITIRDRSHPIVKDMPVEWKHASDELYHGMRGPIENVHLIATAYSDKNFGGTGENEPMIWTVSYGKGRVFHTPMGHDTESMHCLGFIATLQRGTEWAATGQVTVALPKDFPTAEKTSSRGK
jgi:type 1 glutamine amidotransferase